MAGILNPGFFTIYICRLSNINHFSKNIFYLNWSEGTYAIPEGTDETYLGERIDENWELPFQVSSIINHYTVHEALFMGVIITLWTKENCNG